MSTGYRNPPASGRFVKGQTGNPKGRPRSTRIKAPYEAVLGQKVTVREGGRERRLSASEAFLLQITRRGLEGDGQAAQVAMRAIEDAKARQMSAGATEALTIVWVSVSPGSLAHELSKLKMARKLDPYRPSAKLKIEPWLVQTALDRLGDRRLTVNEQLDVYGSTRTPWKVRWPEWWVVQS